MLAALKLVLGNFPLSARKACRQVFGEGFPNVHKTLGNIYKRNFGDSIGRAKHLDPKVRNERIAKLEEEGVVMGEPGNPEIKAYLTPDEEELLVSFLQTCNYMHMPFNRDAFKVSTSYPVIHTCHITHIQHHTHIYLQHHTHLQGLICSIALANGRHENPVASDFYVRKFLERHPELVEIKTSKLGHHRAKQATAEVRDAVFGKLQVCYFLVRC